MATAEFTETYQLKRIDRYRNDVELECVRTDDDGDLWTLSEITIPLEAWETMGEPMQVTVTVSAPFAGEVLPTAE